MRVHSLLSRFGQFLDFVGDLWRYLFFVKKRVCVCVCVPGVGVRDCLCGKIILKFSFVNAARGSCISICARRTSIFLISLVL